MKEIFKDIKGYEGLYQVSNLGNIRSLDRKIKNRNLKGKIKKLDKTKFGYLRVELNNNGKKKKYKSAWKIIKL